MICIMVVSLYHVHLCSSNYQHGRYIKTVKRICTLGLRDQIENLYESSCNHIFNRCVQLMRFSLPLDWSYSSFPNHACNSPRYIFLSLPHDITATEKGISMKLGWLWTFSLWCKQLQLNRCVGKDPKWHMIDRSSIRRLDAHLAKSLHCSHTHTQKKHLEQNLNTLYITSLETHQKEFPILRKINKHCWHKTTDNYMYDHLTK